MKIANKEEYQSFVNKLYELSSGDEFISFQKNIISTKKIIIGVRTPALRKLAQEIFKEPHDGLFEYYEGKSFEETLVLGFTLAKDKNRERAIIQLNKLLPKLDNWAEVDMIAGSLEFAKDNALKEENFEYFVKLTSIDKEFVCRFGVIGIMKFFTDKEYLLRSLEAMYAIKCDKYYVNMAISWCIAEILTKNLQNAIEIMQKIIKNSHFNSFVINKAIQKACESYRISDEVKLKLKEMKIR